MPIDRFFIAPYDKESGQQNDVKPWLIPDSAFEELTNAYVFRGRVRKRFGSRWMGGSSLQSRLRILIGTTLGPINLPGTASSLAIGQMFSVGSDVFTVYQLGAAALTLSSNPAATATINSVANPNTVTFTGLAGGTDVYWYPGLPVMGLLGYENAEINDEFLIGFDTRYAYEYNNGWQRLAGEVTPGAATWTGDNSQFFWGTTWSGANAFDRVFFVTNFNENEPNFMRTFFNSQWDNFRPLITASTYLNSARIIVVFKNRLVCFNTWEGATAPGDNYVNRARYSQIGSPLAADAWRQDIPGRGSAVDCPTLEAIVTVEFIKDRLIVFFERSTWEFVYTGNQIYPFTWQQINTELGAESTFSIVPFDKVAIGVGNVGIMACNGSNTERIDDKIPDTVFAIHNTDGGIFRVYGIRDYYVEMVYWTFPDSDTSEQFPYPSRVLIYNYKTGTWAFNEDSITVFGYFQPVEGITWDSDVVGWDDSVSWDSGAAQAKFRQVIAGNQEGYTFICDADEPTNAAVLQITNITSTPVTQLTIIDHNLRDEEYVYISGAVYSDASDGLNNQIFQVIAVIDKDNIEIGPVAPFTGTYIGGGLIARVSNIVIRTKQYNFYADKGRNAYVSKIDFMVDNNSIIDSTDTIVSGSQLQVNFFASTNVQNLLNYAQTSGTILGTGTLDAYAYESIPFERTASRLWHPVYFQVEGEVVQFELTMNNEQMTTVIPIVDGGITSYSGPALVDFQMHAIVIFAQPTSYRLQ